MSRELIVSREKEIRQLQECFESKESQLVLVYGRRRVGKSFLINQFFDERFDFKLVGDNRLNKEEQLYNFYDELSRQSGRDVKVPESWREAFFQLRDYLDGFRDDEKHVVFFDEMPWLDNQKSGFLAAFEYFWNSFGASKNNLMLIVCGSATSWLVDNFDHNKGGLFNRQNCRIYLEPFNLYESEKYLVEKKGINWSRPDICECYMALGGIPYYLNLLSKRLSYSANIDNLFFKKRGALWDEFDHLYKTLFSKSDSYIKIVETLFTKRMGMPKKELLEKSKLPDNSFFT
ncbi:MAG: AAA family ATPase, partial [Treponema sp.]|nr:AAA family ATPase [Treponema sp.]